MVKLPAVRKKQAWELALEQVDGKLEALDLKQQALERKIAQETKGIESLKQKAIVFKRRVRSELQQRAKTLEADAELRHWAATKIQASYRRRLAWLQTQKMKKRRDHGEDLLGVSVERVKLAAHLGTLTVLCHNLVYTPACQQRKARILGRWWRQVLHNRQRVLHWLHRDVVDTAEVLHGAALVVQALVRGHAARKRAWALKAERDAKEQQELQQRLQEAERASIQLERFGRGLLARRQAAQRRDELRALGAKQDQSGGWVLPPPGARKPGEPATGRGARDAAAGVKLGEDKPPVERRGRTATGKAEADSPAASPGRKSRRTRRTVKSRKTHQEESLPKAKKDKKPKQVTREEHLVRAKEQCANLFSASVTTGMCDMLRLALAPQDPPPRMAPSTYNSHPDFEELARSLFTIRFS